jgi:hypothetical protein
MSEKQLAISPHSDIPCRGKRGSRVAICLLESESMQVNGSPHRFVAPNDKDALMAGQGSSANVIAAVCSFFIAGLGQLV